MVINVPGLTIDSPEIVHVGLAGSLIGCLRLTAPNIKLSKLWLVDEKGGHPCIKVRLSKKPTAMSWWRFWWEPEQQPSGIPLLQDMKFYRNGSFNDSISSFVQGPFIARDHDELTVQVTPPSGREMFRDIAIGACTGFSLYWAWLMPLLIAAGHAIAAGPASIVFGPCALAWSGTMGATSFAGLGSMLGGSVRSTLIMYSNYWEQARFQLAVWTGRAVQTSLYHSRPQRRWRRLASAPR